MKEPKQTLLELIQHITISHPDLMPAIERLLLQVQQKNIFDSHLLLALYESLLSKSKSQLRQDIFVLFELNFKRDGYFIEFGATNGIDLSNTYLLEKDFGWKGILAEPAKLWHQDLSSNRNVHIDNRCVWKYSNETLLFNETSYAELSTIDSISSSDHHAKAREGGKKYPVTTISLMDLLNEYQAPFEIDYLSIDTEGSEFEILEDFDFNKYKIKIITCEHNFSPMREKLSQLFTANGYERKLENISQFDDWWILK